MKHAVWKRRLAQLSRWLHIYVSLASFGILLFFAVTGLTLNHTEWFAHQQRTVQVRGELNQAWLAGPDKLNVVEFLRARHGVKGALTDFRIDEMQLGVSFKGPGYTADTFVDRATGRYELTETRMGFFAIINDLHKGRDSGRVWSAVIDISAVLMTLVSLTGLVLIFFLYRKRFSGLVSLAVGAAVSYLIYRLWVP